MLHKIRLAAYIPLWWMLQRTSVAAAIERDAVRARMPHEPPTDLPAAAELSRWTMLESISTPQVRSVAYARLYFGRSWERALSKIIRRILPGLRDFELNCSDIGPGLVIGHGYGTVIWAQRIGQDCTIHQGATVGVSLTLWTAKTELARALPTLGDGVWVAPGATILGGVRVGNAAVIAAHAVVIRDVPEHSLAVGVPASVRQRVPRSQD